MQFQSIWGDMAMTVGEYLYKLLVPNTTTVHMNMTEIEVHHAQVISDDSTKPHHIQLKADLDLASNKTSIQWYSLSSTTPTEAFATCTVRYESPVEWQREWSRIGHFVAGRIADLERLAAAGEATRLNRHMAYELFRNVVDYSDKYQGMRSVVQSGYEAVADVTLAPDAEGTWHSAPHFIDSVFHVGGLVLNGGGAVDARQSFYVTPGWSSYRLLSPLRPGESYRSYVNMVPMDEPNMFAGDVYVLQGNTVVGMMGEMKFRRVPRLLMSHFFSPTASAAGKKTEHAAPTRKVIAAAPVVAVPKPSNPTIQSTPAPVAPTPVQLQKSEMPKAEEPTIKLDPIVPEAPAASGNPVITDCLKLIARETGLELSHLTDDASFTELGVDSLMSLVLSEKFRAELQLDVKSSLFLECPNIANLKEWLEEYC